MVNPFEKRATEYLRDDESFLSVVTPEPLITFLQPHAHDGKLYDRLAMLVGTPGSGKTTLARLFQYPTITTLLRNRDTENYKPLLDTLTSCGAIRDDIPVLIGARLSLESEYREFWEFPYKEELKSSLMTSLLQARTILLWLRNAQAAGVPIDSIEIIPRSDAEAALHAIGGVKGSQLLKRARDVERAIYGISAALLPPEIDNFDAEATTAYRPFDVIEAFRLIDEHGTKKLRPLVIFDDAHSLHPGQFKALSRWLARRDLRVARWILTRLEALKPDEVLMVPNEETGFNRTREITEIWMQEQEDRGNQRFAFRKMAKGMTSRYLRRMEVFNQRSVNQLGDILATDEPELSRGNVEHLRKAVDQAQKSCGVTATRRESIETKVSDYLSKAKLTRIDLHLSMTSILMHRYAKRTPQIGLFEGKPEDFIPSKPLKADSGVLDGARIHLLHKYDRPYYFGVNMLCDAGWENAEQMLRLTARLVAQSEANSIRRRGPTLSSKDQDRLLRSRAKDMIDEWDFPQHHYVRRICDGIAKQCLEKSLENNASLNGGATAFGIPQEAFDSIFEENPSLARSLQFGIAYNAFVLVPNKDVKNRLWCLIELGGLYRLHTGLTLKRGGFLERNLVDLVALMNEGSS